MTYTLWSNGRLLGYTDLGFRGNTEFSKFGWFHPTEIGEHVIYVMTDFSRVLLERDGVDKATLSADLSSASNRIDAMSLELQDDRGIVVNTESIGFNDTELLLKWADRDDGCDEFDARSFEEMMEDDDPADLDLACLDGFFDSEESEELGEPSPLPRYQIIVRLPESVSAARSSQEP